MFQNVIYVVHSLNSKLVFFTSNKLSTIESIPNL